LISWRSWLPRPNLDSATPRLALAEPGSGVPSLRLLATARTDFLDRLGSLPGLGSLLGRNVYLLGALDPLQQRDVITGPAQAMGFRFESQAMIEELVHSLGGSAHRLPLLRR
jgi:hypothetical protein